MIAIKRKIESKNYVILYLKTITQFMLKTMPSFVANDRQYKETSWMLVIHDCFRVYDFIKS